MARLFEARGRMAYGIARAMLRDVHDAEDATQQAFLSAYRALLRGARVRDEGAWIATIVRNECRARIAATMRIPPPLADEDLDSLAAPGDEAERRLQGAAIRSALAGLPDRQREAVLLRDLYGLRNGEVAKALGLSRPATEALLFRARRTLRLRLRPVLGSVLVLPASLRDAIAEAIPDYPAPGTGSAASAGALGLLAKLGAAPVTAKLATAAVAVTTVGAVGAVETHRVGRQPPVASAPAASTSADDIDNPSVDSRALDEHGSGGPASRGRHSSSRDDDVRGERSSGREDRDSSGDSAFEERNDDLGTTGDDDGATDDEGSSSTGGPGSGDTVAGGEGSGDSGSSSSGPGPSETSEPVDTSGSSDPSESSGPGDGSGEESISEVDDRSGESALLEETSSELGDSGSGGSGSGDGSSGGSGDSGSGDSGSGGS